MEAMKKGSLKSSLFLLLAAFIWGVAFVAQSVGMDYMGPFSFNGARFILGCLVLFTACSHKKAEGHKGRKGRRTLWGYAEGWYSLWYCSWQCGTVPAVWNHVYHSRKGRIYHYTVYYPGADRPVFSLGKRPVERYGSGRLWQLSACICSV